MFMQQIYLFLILLIMPLCYQTYVINAMEIKRSEDYHFKRPVPRPRDKVSVLATPPLKKIKIDPQDSQLYIIHGLPPQHICQDRPKIINAVSAEPVKQEPGSGAFCLAQLELELQNLSAHLHTINTKEIFIKTVNQMIALSRYLMQNQNPFRPFNKEMVIQTVVDALSKPYKGRTLLQNQALAQHWNIVKYLLEKGFIEIVLQQEIAYIASACKKQQEQKIQNRSDEFAHTALGQALRMQKEEIVHKILEFFKKYLNKELLGKRKRELELLEKVLEMNYKSYSIQASPYIFYVKKMPKNCTIHPDIFLGELNADEQTKKRLLDCEHQLIEQKMKRDRLSKLIEHQVQNTKEICLFKKFIFGKIKQYFPFYMLKMPSSLLLALVE